MICLKACVGGQVVSSSGSKTSLPSSTPASAIIYNAYTSITKKNDLPNVCNFDSIAVSIYADRNLKNL